MDVNTNIAHDLPKKITQNQKLTIWEDGNYMDTDDDKTKKIVLKKDNENREF
jgi:hypothetical protein